MSVQRRFIIDLHAPASPYLVTEFIKILASSIHREHLIPVVTRPTGLAAQSGIPEAWRHAYKNNMMLSILPEIRDAIEIYSPDEVFIFTRSHENLFIEDLELDQEKKTILIILPSGEQSLTKEEAALGKRVFTKLFTKEINPLTALGIIATLVKRILENH
mgnify:CR=1 FL=1